MEHFDIDIEKLQSVVDLIASLMDVQASFGDLCRKNFGDIIKY
ncbi:hypothetical protein QUF80_12260 [Desulfococcaceae bacterium HSG8]|nr:hypothetical protein [Desulfococcaceae bacterium HSG8]